MNLYFITGTTKGLGKALAERLARDANNAVNQWPRRMLPPQQVSNLLVAGRGAPMEPEGQTAARASGACFVMGQAAGTAAALMLKQGLASGQVGPALQDTLRRDGAELG